MHHAVGYIPRGCCCLDLRCITFRYYPRPTEYYAGGSNGAMMRLGYYANGGARLQPGPAFERRGL